MYTDIHAFAATPAAAPTPGAAERNGSWPELLSDLACLGQVWLVTETPALTLSHRTAVSSAGVQSGIGHVRGPGFALRILLERCGALAPAVPDSAVVASPHSIVIEDRTRTPMIAVRPVMEADPTGFLARALLRAHGVVGRRSLPAPDRPVPLPGLRAAGAHLASDLSRRCAGLADGIDLMDQAELSGLLSLEPRRLRDRGHAVGVDPDLVPCVLESMADQVVPLRIVTGNQAVVRRVDADFFVARRRLGRLHLQADAAIVRLDIGALDTAWVFRPADGPALRQLRLYDDAGRAVAVVGPVPEPGGGEHPLWTRLLDAMLD